MAGFENGRNWPTSVWCWCLSNYYRTNARNEWKRFWFRTSFGLMCWIDVGSSCVYRGHGSALKEFWRMMYRALSKITFVAYTFCYWGLRMRVRFIHVWTKCSEFDVKRGDRKDKNTKQYLVPREDRTESKTPCLCKTYILSSFLKTPTHVRPDAYGSIELATPEYLQRFHPCWSQGSYGCGYRCRKAAWVASGDR